MDGRDLINKNFTRADIRKMEEEVRSNEEYEGEEYTDFAGLASIARKLGMAGAIGAGAVSIAAFIRNALKNRAKREKFLRRLSPEERKMAVRVSRGELGRVGRREYYEKSPTKSAVKTGALLGGAAGALSGLTFGARGAAGLGALGAAGGATEAYIRSKMAQRRAKKAKKGRD